MKRFLILLSIASFVMTPFALLTFPKIAVAQSSTCYYNWTDEARRIKLTVCEYNSGSSGFYKLENLTGQTVDVCWTLTARSGKTSKGCHYGFEGYKKASSSCYMCNRGNSSGPVTSLTWRRLDWK